MFLNIKTRNRPYNFFPSLLLLWVFIESLLHTKHFNKWRCSRNGAFLALFSSNSTKEKTYTKNKKVWWVKPYSNALCCNSCYLRKPGGKRLTLTYLRVQSDARERSSTDGWRCERTRQRVWVGPGLGWLQLRCSLGLDPPGTAETGWTSWPGRWPLCFPELWCRLWDALVFHSLIRTSPNH